MLIRKVSKSLLCVKINFFSVGSVSVVIQASGRLSLTSVCLPK